MDSLMAQGLCYDSQATTGICLLPFDAEEERHCRDTKALGQLCECLYGFEVKRRNFALFVGVEKIICQALN
jgi:hypothetical protein